MNNKLAIKDDNRQYITPKGIYCYDEKGVCPYWNLKTKYNGYCALLGIEDDEINGTSILWDQCKECGINIEECLDND